MQGSYPRGPESRDTALNAYKNSYFNSSSVTAQGVRRKTQEQNTGLNR